MTETPEPELIRLAQEGDVRAFKALFLGHRHRVLSLIHRMLGPSGDVDDVAQEVFLQVFRSLPSFRGDARFTTWLYRVTANVVRMHLRKGRSRPKLVALGGGEESAFERVEPNTPATLSERNERAAALYRALEQLSPKKREVLVMHDLEGLAAAAIAEIVEAPVLTVRTRLFYARKELYVALSTEPAMADAAEWAQSKDRGGQPRRAVAAAVSGTGKAEAKRESTPG